MNLFRCLFLIVLTLSFASCSKNRKPKSQAKIYESDTNPGISMHDESPGTPVGDR